MSSTARNLFAPQERTLPRLLTRQAERYRDRPLIVIGDVTLTYRSTLDLAARSAGVLAAAGIAPGDRVALICSNRLEFLEVYLGCVWLGAVAVPINIASRGVQLEYILRHSGARLIAIEAELLPSLRTVTDAELLSKDVWVIGDAKGEHFDLPTARAMPKDGQSRDAHPSRPGDTVAILYTSGTTGPSKGVCCPQAQFYWWGLLTSEYLGMREGDVLMTPLPLFHTNALNACYQALLTGSTIVIEKRFSASGFVGALRRHKATVT